MEPGKNTAITAAITPTNGAAGTSDINGATLDMLGFDSVLIICTTGTITASAVTSIKAQQGDQSDASDMSDLLGSAQTIADDDDEDLFVIALIKPQKRYVRLVVDRATQNAVVASATYIQFSPRKAPVSHGSTVNIETHVSPAEGTA